MCVLWVCVYFDLPPPFSIPCSSSWRPLDSSKCPQFGKIPMADILHLYSTLQFPCTSAWCTDWTSKQVDVLVPALPPTGWMTLAKAILHSAPHLQMGDGEHWRHTVLGVYKLRALTKWGNIDERLWKLWSAIPMYVIIIFLTKLSCEIRMRSRFAVIPVYGSISVILMRMLECIQLSWHCQIPCLSAYF